MTSLGLTFTGIVACASAALVVALLLLLVLGTEHMKIIAIVAVMAGGVLYRAIRNESD